MQVDFRIDSSLGTFTHGNDRGYIFGDADERFAPLTDTTLLAVAHGSAQGSIAAKTWAFIDGNTLIDTGVTLAQNTVYRFTFVVDPDNQQYTAAITDGAAGAGHTYTSGWLDWDNPNTFTSSTTIFIEAGARMNTVNETITFSMDTVRVTPPPPTAPSAFTATAASSSQINLSWTDNSSTETGHTLEWSTSSTFSTITGSSTPAANATSASGSMRAADALHFG